MPLRVRLKASLDGVPLIVALNELARLGLALNEPQPAFLPGGGRDQEGGANRARPSISRPWPPGCRDQQEWEQDRRQNQSAGFSGPPHRHQALTADGALPE